jgi:hypothetical protein
MGSLFWLVGWSFWKLGWLRGLGQLRSIVGNFGICFRCLLGLIDRLLGIFHLVGSIGFIRFMGSSLSFLFNEAWFGLRFFHLFPMLFNIGWICDSRSVVTVLLVILLWLPRSWLWDFCLVGRILLCLIGRILLCLVGGVRLCLVGRILLHVSWKWLRSYRHVGATTCFCNFGTLDGVRGGMHDSLGEGPPFDFLVSYEWPTKNSIGSRSTLDLFTSILIHLASIGTYKLDSFWKNY